MMQPASSRLSIRRIDERSLGFVVAGASNVASRWMIDAIRQQAPAAGSQDVAGAWVVGVYSHNPRRARQFANDHGIIHAADELTVLVERRDAAVCLCGQPPPPSRRYGARRPLGPKTCALRAAPGPALG